MHAGVPMIDQIIAFYQGWKAESNPWKETWREILRENPNRTLVVSLLNPFLPYLIFFTLLNEAGRYIGQKYGGPLAARPTVLAGSFHAVATSALALYVLLVREDGTESNDGSVSMSRWSPWQHIGVPLSVSYFAMDTVYYALAVSNVERWHSKSTTFQQKETCK